MIKNEDQNFISGYVLKSYFEWNFLGCCGVIEC